MPLADAVRFMVSKLPASLVALWTMLDSKRTKPDQIIDVGCEEGPNTGHVSVACELRSTNNNNNTNLFYQPACL